MTRATLLHVLDHATALGPAEVRELEQLAQAFPYCQTAHLLLAKAAHDQGTMLAGQRLRRAATYAADRTLLRRLIEQVDPAVVAGTRHLLRTAETRDATVRIASPAAVQAAASAPRSAETGNCRNRQRLKRRLRQQLARRSPTARSRVAPAVQRSCRLPVAGPRLPATECVRSL